MLSIFWILAACGKPPACKEEPFCPLPPEDLEVLCVWEDYEAVGWDECFARTDLFAQICADDVAVEVEVVDAQIECTAP